MAVYGIGATFIDEEDHYEDYFEDFTKKGNEFALLIWDKEDAPELYKLFQSVKIGDIFYIKSYNPSQGLTIKAAGIVSDNNAIKSFYLRSKKTGSKDKDEKNERMGISVKWVWKGEKDAIDKDKKFMNFDANMDKYNVRNIAIYEEFNEKVLRAVIDKITSNIYENPEGK